MPRLEVLTAGLMSFKYSGIFFGGTWYLSVYKGVVPQKA
jgi:hypothetical protein